ncbi:hypothetical protein DER44DRAFT_792282 [Fusarium oxysporum]|nr:hypothetical protein DER44DRAFT_792282 [Fusarium oxysporum]
MPPKMPRIDDLLVLLEVFFAPDKGIYQLLHSHDCPEIPHHVFVETTGMFIRLRDRHRPDTPGRCHACETALIKSKYRSLWNRSRMAFPARDACQFSGFTHTCIYIPTATTPGHKCVWCILLTCTSFDRKLPSVSPDLPYHLEQQLTAPAGGAFSASLWSSPSTHFDFDLASAPPCRTSRLRGLGPIRCHHFTHLHRQTYIQPRKSQSSCHLQASSPF